MKLLFSVIALITCLSAGAVTNSYRAVVTDVYDGDTITCDIELGFQIRMVGEKVRLLGINAPELRGSEKSAGYRSADFLEELILGEEIMLLTVDDKRGSFGRVLGIVVLSGVNINDLLVREGLAKYKEY